MTDEIEEHPTSNETACVMRLIEAVRMSVPEVPAARTLDLESPLFLDLLHAVRVEAMVRKSAGNLERKRRSRGERKKG